MLRIGVIADTHGLLRPEALEALGGSDLLLHAGDVGEGGVLAGLQQIAPVHAVRGNTDRGSDTDPGLPPSLRLSLEGIQLLLHHGHLPLPQAALHGADVVVQGHSHRPDIAWRDGRLFLNPGSAGPRRFRLPVSVALLQIEGTEVVPELIQL